MYLFFKFELQELAFDGFPRLHVEACEIWLSAADDLSGRHVGVAVCGDGAETTENDYTPPNEHTVCGCTTRHC